jgi:hypothetical protein
MVIDLLEVGYRMLEVGDWRNASLQLVPVLDESVEFLGNNLVFVNHWLNKCSIGISEHDDLFQMLGLASNF